ncbi:class I SAM-dependent methyltransferase [Microlunatus sp. GCM10028923]|uniref:class I SAM-dependent methyltransferase n=1 Tax=Microlunatus sp. GCM10028923 TaxID=3273400 RepID=UPI0036078860
MRYLTVLEYAHRKLNPATYLEIGVRTGTSLALARCRAIGIDPAFTIKTELHCDVSLFRTTSDAYFSQPDPLAATGGRPFELAFIDGMHLFEYALRDFINAERYSSTKGVIFFDDMMPNSVEEAARVKHTRLWTGDVYSIVEVLRRYRPDLTVIMTDVRPTGLLLVTGLDPENTVLADNFTEILAEFRKPDPQPVPIQLIDRLGAQSPERVMQSDLWDTLIGVEPGTPAREVQDRLSGRLGASLGAAYA